ncbi:MAG: hypothetical protein AABW83_01400 [Nanoarchaeota archaeon]
MLDDKKLEENTNFGVSFNRISTNQVNIPINLEEIFNENELILVDGGISTKNPNFSKMIYDIRSLRSLDSNLIDIENRNVLDIIDFMKRDTVFTIDEISGELYKYVIHIGKSIAYLSKNQKGTLFRRRVNLEGERVSYSCRKEIEDQNLSLLKNYHNNLYNLYNSFKRKSLKINDRRYKFLTDILELIDNKIGLQRDTAYVYGDKELPTKSINDDKLVGVLYYNCMFLKKKTAILTSDSDFARIMGVTPFLMGSDDFLPYNNNFRESLNKNQFNIYIYDAINDKINKRIFEFPLMYKKEFVIRCVSSEENQIFKDKIRNLWIQISEI